MWPGIGGECAAERCQGPRAKPGEGSYKLADGGELHLYVTPAGSRIWRYRYEIGGREELLKLGFYPQAGLAEARRAR